MNSQHTLSAVLFSMALVCAGCGTTTTETPEAPVRIVTAPSGIVTVQVTLDGDVQEYQVPEVAPGTTVADVMKRVDGVEVEIVGSGEMAFMNSIAGKATDTSDGWTYTVDGEFAEVGMGAMELSPPTTVEWTFGGWDSSR